MRVDWLKEWIEDEVSPNRFAGVKLRERTEDDPADLMSVIEDLRLETDRDEMILQIVEEEAEAYFAGQRSAEDAAAIIQNRVRMYLMENQ